MARFLLLHLPLVLSCPLVAVAGEFVEVKTSLGPLRGLRTEVHLSDGTHRPVRMFLGVPYAEPPTGLDGRWRAPRPRMPWGPETRNATSYGPSCIQPSGFNPPIGITSENCLFLNIYGPDPPPRVSPIPVMVWIHGGGYSGGGGDEQRLNGTFDPALMEAPNSTGLVVVTLNYRLGIFGFLGSRELASRDPDGSFGNYGLQDQREALRFVQEHIGQFGGDSSRILLVGQSAGAGSVSCHLAAQRSWGLFQRAGMESGALSTWISVDRESAEANFKTVLQLSNCTLGGVECLLQLPASELLGSGGPDADFQPTVDGVEFTKNPWDLAAEGLIAPGVDIIAGSTAADATYNTPRYADRKYFESFVSSLMSGNESLTKEVLELYLPEVGRGAAAGAYGPYYWLSKTLLADSEMACPARRAARYVSRGGSKAFLYFWSHTPVSASPGQGPSHASEIPFVFHVLNGPLYDMEIHGLEEIKVSTSMAHYWASFAASGDPNPTGPKVPPTWPSWDHLKMQVLNLNATPPGIHPLERFRNKICDFWDAHVVDSPVVEEITRCAFRHRSAEDQQRHCRQIFAPESTASLVV